MDSIAKGTSVDAGNEHVKHCIENVSKGKHNSSGIHMEEARPASNDVINPTVVEVWMSTRNRSAVAGATHSYARLQKGNCSNRTLT